MLRRTTVASPQSSPPRASRCCRIRAEQGHRIHRRRARCARSARAAAAARLHAGGAGGAGARELPPQADGRWRSTSISTALHDRNESLFFRILIDHPDEMTPIVYTPTVGLACQQFGHIFQRPRGIFVSANDRGRVAAGARQLAAARRRDHRGHRRRAHPRPRRPRRERHGHPGRQALAVHGMRRASTRAAACRCCSTSAPTIQRCSTDPLYLGLAAAAPDRSRIRRAGRGIRRPRRGELFPGVVIQFEDFANHNAFRLLERYRDRIPTFNDDIQGTARGAWRACFSALRDHGRQARATRRCCSRAPAKPRPASPTCRGRAMVADGLDEAAARQRCWLFDSKGLVVWPSAPDLAAHKQPFAHEHAPVGDAAGGGDRRSSRPPSSASPPWAAHSPQRSCADDGRAQQAADRVRAVESDVESRSARRSRRIGGPTAGRSSPAARPFDPVDVGRQRVRAAPGQQFVHLPRRGPGRDRLAAQRV